MHKMNLTVSEQEAKLIAHALKVLYEDDHDSSAELAKDLLKRINRHLELYDLVQRNMGRR